MGGGERLRPERGAAPSPPNHRKVFTVSPAPQTVRTGAKSWAPSRERAGHGSAWTDSHSKTGSPSTWGQHWRTALSKHTLRATTGSGHRPGGSLSTTPVLGLQRRGPHGQGRAGQGRKHAGCPEPEGLASATALCDSSKGIRPQGFGHSCAHQGHLEEGEMDRRKGKCAGGWTDPPTDRGRGLKSIQRSPYSRSLKTRVSGSLAARRWLLQVPGKAPCQGCVSRLRLLASRRPGPHLRHTEPSPSCPHLCTRRTRPREPHPTVCSGR